MGAVCHQRYTVFAGNGGKLLHHVPCHFQHVHRFPFHRHLIFVQTGQLDNVPDQGDQPLGFVVNFPCKMGNILRLDNAVTNDLRNAGNGSQRRFQFVRNIRRELPPVLFLCLFLRHVQHQNHSSHHIFRKIRLADGVGDDLVHPAVQLQIFLCVATFQGTVHRVAKALAPVHCQQIFMFLSGIHAEDLHGTFIIG